MDSQPILVSKSVNKTHPYLTGNFAAVKREFPLTPCSYVGSIPISLAGGQYVRNGGNPSIDDDKERDAHWFDGDGMLHGVLFRRISSGTVQPEFVNTFVRTDVYLASAASRHLRSPILPSIATLVNPVAPLLYIILRIFRTLALVFLSHLPGSAHAIKKTSVSNTGILYHDGRGLATCESGPPIRIALPQLETVGWFDGVEAEGEPAVEEKHETFGGKGPLRFLQEWTTAHPRVDPYTGEFIAFHSCFAPPYIHYSVIPPSWTPGKGKPSVEQPLMNATIPGIASPKMMHDFAVSRKHSVIIDMPLSLDPLNLARNRPVVAFDPKGATRFGVLPRARPEEIRWFESPEACCIFHTANAWDEPSETGETSAVNLLACRLNSATLIFNAGNIDTPAVLPSASSKAPELCQLYYYRFQMKSPWSPIEPANDISHQWALSMIPFEFPTLAHNASMGPARYVYGCSMANGSFDAALGRAAKIDCIVKLDVYTLMQRGKEDGSVYNPSTGLSVDTRTVKEILAEDRDDDPIRIFKLPDGWCAQESSFVPDESKSEHEDGGWLLTYVFDEAQLDLLTGEAPANATSELWVIDAMNMRDVVCRVKLPQRVPYGFHGTFFSEEQIAKQRTVQAFRMLDQQEKCSPESESDSWSLWHAIRDSLERCLA